MNNDKQPEKTKLQQLFDLFCDKDGENKDLEEPFRFDDHIYATNRYVMIRCHESDCDFEVTRLWTRDSKPSMLYETNCHKPLFLYNYLFELNKTEDEYEYVGEEIPCQLCGGDGEVEWSTDSYEYTKFDDCPKCNGSGFQQERQKVKTGNKTFPPDATVIFGEQHFQMKYFHFLIKVAEALDADIYNTFNRTSNDNYSKVVFTIKCCEILMMPVMNNIDKETAVINLDDNSKNYENKIIS